MAPCPTDAASQITELEVPPSLNKYHQIAQEASSAFTLVLSEALKSGADCSGRLDDTNSQVQDIRKDMKATEGRVENLSEKMDATLDDIDKKFKDMEAKMEQMLKEAREEIRLEIEAKGKEILLAAEDMVEKVAGGMRSAEMKIASLENKMETAMNTIGNIKKKVEDNKKTLKTGLSGMEVKIKEMESYVEQECSAITEEVAVFKKEQTARFNTLEEQFGTFQTETAKELSTKCDIDDLNKKLGKVEFETYLTELGEYKATVEGKFEGIKQEVGELVTTIATQKKAVEGSLETADADRGNLWVEVNTLKNATQEDGLKSMVLNVQRNLMEQVLDLESRIASQLAGVNQAGGLPGATTNGDNCFSCGRPSESKGGGAFSPNNNRGVSKALSPTRGGGFSPMGGGSKIYKRSLSTIIDSARQMVRNSSRGSEVGAMRRKKSMKSIGSLPSLPSTVQENAKMPGVPKISVDVKPSVLE